MFDDLGNINQTYLEIGDTAKALKWCKAGADLGSDDCQFETACMYEGSDPRCEFSIYGEQLKGDGIEIDFVAAAKILPDLDCKRGP